MRRMFRHQFFVHLLETKLATRDQSGPLPESGQSNSRAVIITMLGTNLQMKQRGDKFTGLKVGEIDEQNFFPVMWAWNCLHFTGED